MEEFFASNKVVVLRGVFCSEAVLQYDYPALIASLENDNWTKEGVLFNFAFTAGKEILFHHCRPCYFLMNIKISVG